MEDEVDKLANKEFEEFEEKLEEELDEEKDQIKNSPSKK